LQWGEEIEKRATFYDRLLAEGRGPLANVPELPATGEEAWEAFWALSSSRNVGMGPGGIPFLAIDRYAERYEIDDFERFHRLVQAMDAAYLGHVNEREG